MNQDVIDALAKDYATILHNESMSVDEKTGYMLSELVTIWPEAKTVTWNSLRLYAGYIVAAGLRNAPPPIDIESMIRGLI